MSAGLTPVSRSQEKDENHIVAPVAKAGSDAGKREASEVLLPYEGGDDYLRIDVC